jgi:hypothetical protein
MTEHPPLALLYDFQFYARETSDENKLDQRFRDFSENS